MVPMRGVDMTTGDAVAKPPVGRLAPSPTGVLHLGNARTFLLTWLDIRTRGGTLLLRIEDIDGPRVKSGAERATLEDLAWLGLDWDGAPLRQSEHCARYRAHVDGLIERGLAYPCICTRKEIEDAASAPHEDWLDAAPYPGTCRGRFPTLAAARAATGREPAVRYRVRRTAASAATS
jgi:glutamyl/glutaminyl-tRNA synthetase